MNVRHAYFGWLMFVTLLCCAALANVHYLWVTVKANEGEQGAAQIFFEEGPFAGPGEYLDRYTLRVPQPSMPLYHLVGALDPLTRDRLQQSFLAVRRRLGLTAVFVTHDMVEALLLADRIAVLNKGMLVQVGTPAELLRAPADGYVEQMLVTPRRQSRALDALLAGHEAEDLARPAP